MLVTAAVMASLLSQYATVEKDGELFLTHNDFVCHYLQLADSACHPETKLILARVADTTKDG